MPTAKTYSSWEICGDPYIKNKKQYVLVKKPNGTQTKEVRWYSDSKYQKMYPNEEKEVRRLRSVQDVLGFKEGYITIFKGDTYPLLEWFQKSPLRYHKLWGWYGISEEPLPEPIPAGIEPVRLPWSAVSVPGEDALKPDAAVKAEVDKLIYEPSISQHVGVVGERIDIVAILKRAITLEDGYYGPKMFYLFVDDEGIEYTWSTTPRDFEEGTMYAVRGTIQAHNLYKGSPQNALTRCTVKTL